MDQEKAVGSNVLRTVGGFKPCTNVNFGDRLTTTDGLASFEVQGRVEQVDNTTRVRGSDITRINPLFAPEWDAVPYTFMIPAGSSIGAAVGTVAATDPEGDPVTYSIVPGPFAINPTSSAITVADAAAVATDTTYNIAVTASDGDLSNSTTGCLLIHRAANHIRPKGAGGAVGRRSNSLAICRKTLHTDGREFLLAKIVGSTTN